MVCASVICTVCAGAAWHWLSVRSCCDKRKVMCRACLNLSRLCYGCQHCTLAVALHLLRLTYYVSAWGRSGKYLNAHLKHTVYGRKYVRIHTHLHNAVPLVCAQAHPLPPPPKKNKKNSKYVPRSRMHLRDIWYLYQDFIQNWGGRALGFLPQENLMS